MGAKTGDDNGKWSFRDDLDVPIYKDTQVQKDLELLRLVILSIIMVVLFGLVPVIFFLLNRM